MTVILLITWGLFCAGDLLAYICARYPERRYWPYRIPGGGYVALWRLGRRPKQPKLFKGIL